MTALPLSTLLPAAAVIIQEAVEQELGGEDEAGTAAVLAVGIQVAISYPNSNCLVPCVTSKEKNYYVGEIKSIDNVDNNTASIIIGFEYKGEKFADLTTTNKHIRILTVGEKTTDDKLVANYQLLQSQRCKLLTLHNNKIDQLNSGQAINKSYKTLDTVGSSFKENIGGQTFVVRISKSSIKFDAAVDTLEAAQTDFYENYTTGEMRECACVFNIFETLVKNTIKNDGRREDVFKCYECNNLLDQKDTQSVVSLADGSIEIVKCSKNCGWFVCKGCHVAYYNQLPPFNLNEAGEKRAREAEEE